MLMPGAAPPRYQPRDMDPILIVNAGSSSVKFQVFDAATGKEPKRLIKGQVDGIGTQPRLRGQAADGEQLIDRRFGRNDVADVPAGLQAAAAWLRERYNMAPIAVGHRVVHGGPNYDGPVLVD